MHKLLQIILWKFDKQHVGGILVVNQFKWKVKNSNYVGKKSGTKSHLNTNFGSGINDSNNGDILNLRNKSIIWSILNSA